MKLLVLQNYDAQFDQIAALSCSTMLDYAQRHGYRYCGYRGTYSGLASSWDKLFLAEVLLDAHDFVWTIDTDVVILNPAFRISDLIDQAYDVNICGDGAGDFPWNVNCGSVVWKASPWTKAFLRGVANEGFSSESPTWEQAHIQFQLRSPEVAAHFKRHHFTRFNHHGEFLRHFCGTQDIATKLDDIRSCIATLRAAGTDDNSSRA